MGRREETYSRDGNHPMRVVWVGVKRAGRGVASPLCDTPTERSDEGGRAAASCGGWNANLLDNRLEK